MPLKTVLALCALLSGCAALNNKPEIIIEPTLMPMAPPAGPSRRVVQQITALWPDRMKPCYVFWNWISNILPSRD